MGFHLCCRSEDHTASAPPSITKHTYKHHPSLRLSPYLHRTHTTGSAVLLLSHISFVCRGPRQSALSFLLLLLSLTLIHQCFCRYRACLPACSQTPSLFPNVLSFCALLIPQSLVFSPFAAYSAHPLPLPSLFWDALSILLFTPLLRLFSYPSLSLSVCLILSPSSLSLSLAFFHLLVSYFCDTHTLAGRWKILIRDRDKIHVDNDSKHCIFFAQHGQIKQPQQK